MKEAFARLWPFVFSVENGTVHDDFTGVVLLWRIMK